MTSPDGRLIYWPIDTHFSACSSEAEFFTKGPGASQAANQQHDGLAIVRPKSVVKQVKQANGGMKRIVDRESRRFVRRDCQSRWPGYQMARALLSGFILAMEVLLSNFDINQSHIGVVMTEQAHQGW